MHRNNKTRKSIAVLLVTLITVVMLGVSPTLAEAGSCKGAVGALAASGAACLAAANAGAVACVAEAATGLFFITWGTVCAGAVTAAALTCGGAVPLSTIWTFVRC